jgi:hypothetical protein
MEYSFRWCVSKPLGSIFALILLSILVGCQPDPELVTVPNNQPPADTAVARLTVETYVNRLYINLMGRKPTGAELRTNTDALFAANLAVANRRSLIRSLTATEEYRLRLYDEPRATLLNGASDSDIDILMIGFQQAILIETNPTIKALLQIELDKLSKLRAIPDRLRAGTLTVQQMHSIIVDNQVYNDINMGIFNYTLSFFESFLQRNPTGAEHESAMQMNDGLPAVLFLREGSSREDFIDIFLSSQAYYEGQVRQLFRRTLFRDPTSVEMTQYTNLYAQSGSYANLLEALLATDEFLGIQ